MIDLGQYDWNDALSYKFLTDMMDSIDDSIDNSIRSVFETKLYQNELDNLSKQSNENHEKGKNVASLMAPFLLKSLNNPFFDIEEVKSISQSTGLTERQIRDYLRNQRKRKINYLNGLQDTEKDNIEQKLNYLYGFIDQAIKEYISMKNEMDQNEMEEFVFFPKKT